MMQLLHATILHRVQWARQIPSNIAESSKARNVQNSPLSETLHRVGSLFPDLSPQIVSVGFLKGSSLKRRKAKVRKEVKDMKQSILKDVMNNFCLRLGKCKDLKGARLGRTDGRKQEEIVDCYQFVIIQASQLCIHFTLASKMKNESKKNFWWCFCFVFFLQN